MTFPFTRRAASTTITMLLAAVAALAATFQALAGGKSVVPHPLGDHPAIVVQRLQRTAGYDYAAKFYPHPAHLYLLPASPDELARMQAAARAALIDNTPDTAPEAVPGPLAQR